MTRVDWIALGIAALSALSGLRRGLIATVLSLAGITAGAVIGGRLAPQFLHGGSQSRYTPLAALAGAIVGAALVQGFAALVGASLRRALFVLPPLRLLDSIGGLVAGARDIAVSGHRATVYLLDRHNDVAVLRVPRLTAQPLPSVDPREGDSIAILGYPENGPFDARAGRIGNTADVLVSGTLREVTALSGLVRHGNSGGPAVNVDGEVEAMVFAARIGTRGGYGVPAAPVRAALGRAKRPVSTGKC